MFVVWVLFFFSIFNLKACQENATDFDSKQESIASVRGKADVRVFIKDYLLPLRILKKLGIKAEKDKYVYITDMYDCFFKAAKMGNLVALKYFEEQMCDSSFELDTCDSNGLSALQEAIYDNNKVSVDFLLRGQDKKSFGNYWLRSQDGKNCLMLINGCTGYKDCGNPFVLRTIKKLLDFDLDPNYPDFSGLDVNSIDDLGKTALMYHAANLPVIELLISYGADISLIDKQGKNFIEYFYQTISNCPDNEYYSKITELNIIFKKYKIDCICV